MEGYKKLGDILVYRLSLELCEMGWGVYNQLGWQEKKIFGDQYIRSVDSVGANIAEGYGRFHYLDRIRFYYNARGSLFEARHWNYIMLKRQIIKNEQYKIFDDKSNLVSYQLNLFIKSCYPNK